MPKLTRGGPGGSSPSTANSSGGKRLEDAFKAIGDFGAKNKKKKKKKKRSSTREEQRLEANRQAGRTRQVKDETLKFGKS